jgi:hypothetical protein
MIAGPMGFAPGAVNHFHLVKRCQNMTLKKEIYG